jgi:hypothetical protein
MKKTFGFLLLFVAAVICVGCSTTSPGTNRQQLAKNSPSFLPFKVIISEKGRDIQSVGTAEQVSYKDLLPMFGLSSFGIARLAKNETAIAAIRGRFAAGEAFEETGRMLCSSEPTARVIKLELLRFKHFGSSTKPGYTGVSGLMQFSAELFDSHQVTLSSYAFAWHKKGNFFASQERDVLREIMENALGHWGQQFGDQASAVKVAGFPGPESGQFSVGDADYVYDIFNPAHDNAKGGSSVE